MRIYQKHLCGHSENKMIDLDRIMHILSLPKTLVVGSLNKAFNNYTLFCPYRENTEYAYILITELNEFEKRRIELGVPFSEEEEYICRAILSKKAVFSLQSCAVSNTIIIPDDTTRLITKRMVQDYPFSAMYIPRGALITPLAAEEKQNIEFKEWKKCESERYAEVFGQPKKQNS